jgi:thymidylate synthase (FAD)
MAQVTRHRLASFSIQSQRYAGAYHEEGTFNYIMPPSIEALGEEAVKAFETQMAQMQAWYNEWAEKQGKKGESTNEDARFVLPNAAETKIIMTMNARELLHFFNLRCCNRAQWEIRAMAEEMLKLLLPLCPNLFRDAGPLCLTGPCPEGKMCCGKTKEVKAKYEKLFNEVIR